MKARLSGSDIGAVVHRWVLDCVCLFDTDDDDGDDGDDVIDAAEKTVIW